MATFLLTKHKLFASKLQQLVFVRLPPLPHFAQGQACPLLKVLMEKVKAPKSAHEESESPFGGLSVPLHGASFPFLMPLQ